MSLSRDAIQAVKDLVYEDVPVPEWGGSVRVRSLTGAERNSYELSLTKRDRRGQVIKVNAKMLRASLLIRACVDDKGKPLFTEADVPWLLEKNAAVIERLFDAIRRLSGMTEADVEELEKNSSTVADDDGFVSA